MGSLDKTRLRRGTYANLVSANLVFGEGEPVFETDTRRWKVGNGTSEYVDLQYVKGDPADYDALELLVTTWSTRQFDTIEEFEADTSLTHTAGEPGSVQAGDVILIGGSRYDVAPSGAGDGDLSNSNSAPVELYEAGPNFFDRDRLVAAHDRNVAAGRTVPAGTEWTWPGAKIVASPGATSIPGLPDWEPFGTTAKFSLFGAVGDTVIAADGTLSSGTDDTSAMQAACDWANAARGRKVLGDDGATYRVTAEITGTGDLRVDLGSARIFSTANANIFDWEATLYGPYDLATSYTAGDLSIDLTGDPLPVAPLKGAIMKIVSDGVDPGNRDEGSNTNQYRIGEWFVVGSGSTTTNIVLHRPLRFTRAISPTSTAGDEGEVDSYTTTLSARVIYANPDEVFEFTGGVIGHVYGNDGSWTADAIHLTGYHSPRVLTHVQKCYGSGVRPYGTVDAEVSGCSFADFRADRGYGVSDAGRNTVAKDLRGSNTRHTYSSSVAAMAAGETDPAVLIGAGRTVGAKFGGHAEAGSWAHWDTHHSTDGAAMVDAFSEGGGYFSHAARGRGVDIVRPKSRNMASGIYVFTEYDSGDPDEDYFTAGKTLADFTSARVIDPDIECVEEPLSFANSTVKMSGSGKFVAADHCMIYNNGSSVIIEGHHEFTTLAGTVSHSRTGCIDLDEANSNNGGVLATTLVIEGTVLIDARDASAGTVYGLNLGANCNVIVRGRLKFNLPTGSTLQTGSGTLTVEGDGVVEHYNGTTLQRKIYAPHVPVTPNHFGENTTPGTTDMGTALAAWASYIGGSSGTLLPEEYATSTEVVIDTANTSVEAPAGAHIRQTTWGLSGVQIRATGCSWAGGKVYTTETRSALSSAFASRYEGGLARTRSAAFYVQGDDFVVRDVETDGFVSDVRLTCDRIYRTGEDLTARTTTTTLVLNASDQEVDDFYNGMLLDIQNASGPSEFDIRVITDYDNATNTITFSPAYSSAPTGADAAYLILTGRRNNITIEGLRNTGEVDFGIIDEWTDGLSILGCSWDTITQTQGDTPHSIYLPGDPQSQRSRNVVLADLRTNYSDEGLAYKFRGIDGILADNLSVDRGRGVLLFEQCANAQADTLNIRELGADYSGSAWAARISGGMDVSIKGLRATVSPTFTGSDVNAVEISNVDNNKLYAELDGYHVEDAVLRSAIGTSNNGSITLQAVRIERAGSTADPATKRGVLTDISAIETSGDSVTTRAVFAEAYADDLLIFNPYAENSGGTLNPVRVNNTCENVLTIWNADIQSGTNNISGASNREAYVHPGRQETYEPQGTGTTAHFVHNLAGGSSVQIRVDNFNSLGNVLRDRTAPATGIWRVWSSGDDTTKFIGFNPYLMRMMIGGDLDIQDSSGTSLFQFLTSGNFQIVSPSAPASASASGTAGEIAWDGSYLYVCTATDTWVRAGLATW